MAKVKTIPIEELEQLIEEKILEIIGDPDQELEIRPDFERKIKKRLRKRSKRIRHAEVVKQIDGG